jgi:uridine kinase
VQPDRLGLRSAAYLIGIAGPSCSGKSEIARRLSRLLRAPVLAIDHYYRDLKHIPFDQRAATNFDAPESLDCELIIEHAWRLKQGLTIEQPTYDFTRHVRAEVVEVVGPAPFVILEGLFALYWTALRELLDSRIYIAASHDVCLARRIDRDMRERGRTEDSVRRQYEATVRPMCDRYIAPTEAWAGIVLSGTDPIKKSVLVILKNIGLR